MKNNTNFFNSESVSILLEVLPYIRQFNGASIVVKLGGAAMENADLCKDFARDIALLQLVGIKPVVIHGGGPKITKLLDTLNIPTQFIDGIRVTDEASMEVVEMVLSGNINKEIVAQINSEGGRAVGISGRDASLANAHNYNNFSNNTIINEKEKSNMLGRVGSLNSTDINGELIEVLEKNGYVPVIAPIANDKEGKAMNINADIMAGAIAGHLKAKKLILLTNTPGVIIDNETLTNLTIKEIDEYKKSKKINGGMIPKVDCCINALKNGVEKTHIIDGRLPHAILLEIFTNKGIGTMISNEYESS